MKELLKKFIKIFTDRFKIKDIILFESKPDYSDNTALVFDEMVRRGFNKRYKLIWACNDEKSIALLNEKFKNIENVECEYIYSKKCMYYYQSVARAMICCNKLFESYKSGQYYLDLAHGCALKNAVGYSIPISGDNVDIMTISEYMAPFDAHNLSCPVEYMKPLGYARNDDLFKAVDVNDVFGEHTFKKAVYWLPTYRQHTAENVVHSDIPMPILYSESEALTLNECARENEVLIIVKVHPAQDIKMVQGFNLSNVIFINNDFFDDKDFSNYQLLGSCDAMISDYSSVYYDYLLCDKPIGLCFDDFESYKERKGFTMDPDLILKGGVKIYNIEDMCAFVKSVADGEDMLCDERNEIKNLVHDNVDDGATKRIVDYIESKIQL